MFFANATVFPDAPEFSWYLGNPFLFQILIFGKGKDGDFSFGFSSFSFLFCGIISTMTVGNNALATHCGLTFGKYNISFRFDENFLVFVQVTTRDDRRNRPLWYSKQKIGHVTSRPGWVGPWYIYYVLGQSVLFECEIISWSSAELWSKLSRILEFRPKYVLTSCRKAF